MPHTRRPPSMVPAYLQYLCVRIPVAMLRLLPFPVALWVGRTLARLAHLIDVKHRGVALRNVSAAYPEKDDDECRALVRGVYRHLGTMLIEILFAEKIFRRNRVETHIEIRGREVFDDLLRRKQGAVMVIGHLGNWEVCGYGTTLLGYPLQAIARPLDNPFLDRYLNSFRTGTGQGIVSKYNVLRHVGEFLKDGKMVIFLADQDARRHGMFVPFFGRPSSTVKGPAVAAIRHRVPLIPVNIYRRGKMQHVVEIHPPIEVPPDLRDDAAVRYLVTAYTRQIEEFVREHPEQWLWLHRRWKTKPPEERAVVAKS